MKDVNTEKLFTHSINTVLALISGACIVLSIAAIVWEVVARYVFHSPTIWVSPITSDYLLPAMIFLGAAYTQQSGSFVRVDVFLGRFSAKKKAFLEAVGCIAGIVMATTLVWRGWELSYRSFRTGEVSASTLLNWPVYPSQAMIWIGSLFLCIEIFIKLVNSIKRLLASGYGNPRKD